MKVKLTEEEVLEIFALRAHVNHYESNALTSKELAMRYRVSERTVRDIWSRRTRRDLTQQAWTAEERMSQKQMKQGRPLGTKDGVPRQRQVAQQAPSDFTQSSSSDTTSEDCSPLDSISSTDCESSQGQPDPQRVPPPSSMEPGQNGLLFNQAVLALLRQGIQQPPPGAPGTAPNPQNSQFCHTRHNFPNAFDVRRPPAVPPFTSSQPVQSSLFNGAASHSSLPLQQASSCVPPRSVLPLSNTSIQNASVPGPPVPPFVNNPALSLLQPSQAQQAPPPPTAELSPNNLSLSHSSSQLLKMLNNIVPPSPEANKLNLNAAQPFQYRVLPAGAAPLAQAQATRPSFSFPGAQQGSAFNLSQGSGPPQDLLKHLPNGGVVPGGEGMRFSMAGGSSFSVPPPPQQSSPNGLSGPLAPLQAAGGWAGAHREFAPVGAWEREARAVMNSAKHEQS